MTLDTFIRAGTRRPARNVRALVLMGGGARTAYQVGVLRAVASMLRLRAHHGAARFPFQVLVGTSAGALNAAFLAGAATRGLDAMDELAQFWASLRSQAVYRLHVPRWARFSRLLSAVQLWSQARRHGAMLDTMPLVNTLHKAISLAGIDRALESGALEAVAITASSYTTGIHWTFCHTQADWRHEPWTRPGRRAEFQPLSIEHLMASSAIPFLFPSTALWVDGRREYFGDGSMRQVSPLSPAVQLGASQVLVVGVGQPERAGLAGGPPAGEPGLGAVAGHALGSVFHDTLQADVEQAVRITQTLQQLPRDVAAALPFRAVDVLAIQPSKSLDALALSCVSTMPRDVRRAIGGLSAMRGGGPLASYLLFEPGFVHALIALGEEDAYARKSDLMAFFE